MDAGGRATQEQLPSLHVVNEHFFGKFNDARASEVIFQSFPSISCTTTTIRILVGLAGLMSNDVNVFYRICANYKAV
jgi:hypothetical protein